MDKTQIQILRREFKATNAELAILRRINSNRAEPLTDKQVREAIEALRALK